MGAQASHRSVGLAARQVVEERCCPGRSHSVSSGGLAASEDADISSAKTGENPVHRKPKGSSGRLVL